MSGAPDIRVAGVHDAPERVPGARLSSTGSGRGVKKMDLRHDDWIRDVAPSTELRKWFGHNPEKCDAFRSRYRAELEGNPEAVGRCLDWCHEGPVTLLFAAKDREHNEAVVLRDHLAERLKRRRKCGAHENRKTPT